MLIKRNIKFYVRSCRSVKFILSCPVIVRSVLYFVDLFLCVIYF